MQRESEIESAARSSPAGGADTQPALLQAEGLFKTYPHAPTAALLEFSLSIAPGEIVGLLGPNGAGKTTAISLLTGLLAPDSGRIRIGGIDFVKSPRRVRGWIGLVPQHIALYPSLTAHENLAYFGRMYGLSGPELRAQVDRCLEMVGLAAQAHGRIAAFSGGMKRRANLAAALLHRPRLLFLDEPTAGVDPQSRHLVLEQLSEMSRSGTAMLYTTHYIEEAERICSRVAIIDRGRIIALGTPRQLLDAHPDCADLGALFLRLTGRDLRD